MKYFRKKFYIILFFINILLLSTNIFARDIQITYTKENISNYLSGIISSNQNYTSKAFKYLNKVQSIKKDHTNFNRQFLRTLVLLEKFDQAFIFSKEILIYDKDFFELNLLLGLNFFINKDYSSAEAHFKKLNKVSQKNFLIDSLLSETLVLWTKVSENKKNESFALFDQIFDQYSNLKQIQKIFLNCYFDNADTENSFRKLIQDEDYNYSRYNFFLANYLMLDNKHIEAQKVILESRKLYKTNLLIRQAENFIANKESKKIQKFFNCKNSNDVLAELFYIIANLYAGEKEYQLSNFYLKISLFLNEKFTPNKALLAENFFYQEKFDEAQKVYNSLKSIGSVYSWHASKNLALILSETIGKKKSISNLQNEFNLLLDPNIEHYYELANFYKDYEYYEDSIKYYSFALEKIKKEDHYLVPKILDRRGTSYERLGNWEKAQKDLEESIKRAPNEPYVLNYLAYSWIEKKINIEKALGMLKKATELRKNDGYIIDSLGWAYYANKNYIYAEKYLQKAVELMPFDPVINDHYADSLWMLKRHIQARYFWKHVLTLENTEEELKKKIYSKLLFGIPKKL